MKVDLRILAKILCEVFEIEDITQAITPGGRWALLQAWLKNNPRWKTRVTHWSKITPERAYEELREWISVEAGLQLVILKTFIAPEVEARVKGAIVKIQTLYNERRKDESAHETATLPIAGRVAD